MSAVDDPRIHLVTALLQLATARGRDGRPQTAGLTHRGNIDLNARPIAHNSDGSISTVRSLTFTNPDGSAVLLPSVVGPHVVSNEDAWQHYMQTGENLGSFRDEGSADAYAQLLHLQQDRLYGPRSQDFKRGKHF